MMMAWDMWEHQNKSLHEVEENKQIILKVELNQQIQEVYRQGLSYLPHNSYNLLKRSQAHILWFSAPYKQQWLASVKAAKARFSQQEIGPIQSSRWSKSLYLTISTASVTNHKVVQHLRENLVKPDNSKPSQDSPKTL